MLTLMLVSQLGGCSAWIGCILLHSQGWSCLFPLASPLTVDILNQCCGLVDLADPCPDLLYDLCCPTELQILFRDVTETDGWVVVWNTRVAVV